MAIIFITHDLGVIAQTADLVAVMYLGTTRWNTGPVRDVIRNPVHPVHARGFSRALPKLSDLDAHPDTGGRRYSVSAGAADRMRFPDEVSGS